MKKITTALVIAIITTIAVMAYDQEGSPSSPAATVRQYYSNINAKQFDSNRDVFYSPNSCVACYGRGGGAKSLGVRSAEEFIVWMGSEKQWTHVIDQLSSAPVSDTMATVNVEGHTETWRVNFTAVFTLTNEGGDWRILSMVQENRQE